MYPEKVSELVAWKLMLRLLCDQQKLVKNAAKYPVEKAKGVATK